MILGVEIKPSDKKPVTEDLLIAVGILSGSAVHPGHNRRGPGNATIAEVAAYNEFGTTSKDGKTLLPPRPFLRNALSSEEGQKQVAALLEEILPKLEAGEIPQKQAVGILGEWAQSAVKMEMDALGVVDTGLTKRSVGYAEVDR